MRHNASLTILCHFKLTNSIFTTILTAINVDPLARGRAGLNYIKPEGLLVQVGRTAFYGLRQHKRMFLSIINHWSNKPAGFNMSLEIQSPKHLTDTMYNLMHNIVSINLYSKNFNTGISSHSFCDSESCIIVFRQY